MKKGGVKVCMRVVVSVAMVLIIFEGLAHAQQRYSLSSYFPLTEGATWTYLLIKPSPDLNDVEVYSIARINDPNFGFIYRRFLFDSGEQALLYTYDDMKWSQKGLEVYRKVERNLIPGGDSTIYDPPLVRFPASMSIGETFTDTNYEWSITLEAAETVTVGIGTFTNCLKFEISYDGETWNIWLARGIGVVKNEQGLEVGGLVSFTKGGTTYYPIDPVP